MSGIRSQDATTDQANATTHCAEAEHPMQNNDEASDTKWPNRSCMNEEKAPVTQRKGPLMPKLQQRHLSTRDFEEEKSQQSIDFEQIICQTENSEKLEIKEVSGILFDSTGSVVHSISSDLKLAASIAKQVWEAFPTTYPEFRLNASREKLYLK